MDTVWRELLDRISSLDGYLVLGVLDHPDGVMQPYQARALLWHCLDRELSARHHYMSAGADERVPAARAVVIERSARVAAEQLVLGAEAAHASQAGPVIVRYRMLQQADWSGKVVAGGVGQAARDTRRLMDAARQCGFDLHATTVTREWNTVSAVHVPELIFAATRPELTRTVPDIGL